MKVTIEGTVEEIIKLLGQSVNNVVCELKTTDNLEPNWDDAPEWAMYWAVDSDGQSGWYDDITLERTEWMMGDNGEKYERDKEIAICGIDWKTTLRKRPQ